MKIGKVIVTSLAILLVLGAYLYRLQLQSSAEGLLSLFSKHSTQGNAPLLPERYRTAAVERGDVRQTVTATGTLTAVVTVEVGTQLSGQLSAVLVDFNNRVKKGEPLAELDRRSFEAKVAEARAATAAAQALVAVQRTKIGRARVDILEAKTRGAVLKARLESAKARSIAAARAYLRTNALNARSVSSEAQVELAEAERDVTAAAVREAEALTAALIHTVSAAEVDLERANAELANASAGVPQKEAAQLLAEIDLDRTIIRSPIDGIVVGRNFSEGQTVAASLEAPTLFTIAGDLELMDIHARVDESDIGRIKVGQRASFTVDAHPGRTFEAEVNAVRQAPQQQQPGSVLKRSSQAPSNVVTYTVVLRTNNPGTLLLPGMTAVVRVTVDEVKDTLTVPVAALRFTPNGSKLPVGTPPAPTVWLWDEERHALRPILVSVATSNGVRAAVARQGGREALKEGDQVVVAEAGEETRRPPFGLKLGF
jgi:HlyD family secretion protein